MKAYEKYKNSGTAWIDKIPENWTVVKIKFLNKLNMGQSPNSSDINDSGLGLPFLQGNAEFNDKYPQPINWCLSPNKVAKKNDFLISVRAPVGELNTADQEYGIGRGLCAITAKKHLKNYLLYLLLSCKDELINNSTGTTFLAITVSNFSNIKFPLPPLPEQRQIAAYLDYKTKQIDRFIANRKKQIELLEEQKEAIINKAVTKGIEPTVKLKPSGVDWIGDIPEQWEVCKIRRVISVLTDFTANGSFADLAKNVKYLDSKDYSRLIRLTDLRENLLNENGVWISESSHKFLAKSELFGGEILMANVGAYAGYVCLMPEVKYKCSLAPNMFLMKFSKAYLNKEYIFYLLKSDIFNSLLMNKALSSAQPKLNKEDIRSIDIVFPKSKSEQDKIVLHIESELSERNELISKYQKQIDLMQEYKTSLISKAVTGKIDVREWQPKQTIKETV